MTAYSLMQRISLSLALSRSMGATHEPVDRRTRRAWRWWLPLAFAFALCLGACAHARAAVAPALAGAGAQPR